MTPVPVTELYLNFTTSANTTGAEYTSTGGIGSGTFNPSDVQTNPEIVRLNPAYLGVEFNAVIIAVTIILCAGAVFLNLSIMTYYWPKIKNLIPFLYFILSSSDFVTGVCAGIHSIIFITIIALKNSGYNPIFWLIIPSYFLTVVTFKVSAFVSMIFSVIRTINIVSPFSRVKRKPAIISIFVWLFIWLAVSSLEIGLIVKQARIAKSLSPQTKIAETALIGYFYQPNKGKVFQNSLMDGAFGRGGDRADNDLNKGSPDTAEECLIGIIYTASPVFLCASITLIATIIQVIFLLKSSGAVTSDPEGDMRSKKKISVTIILIGALFIVCSTFTLYQPLCNCYEGQSSSFSYLPIAYVTGYISFFLNSALNPLILVLRVSQLRAYMWGILTCRSQTHGRPAHAESRLDRLSTFISQSSSSSLLGRFIRNISGNSV